MPTTSAADSLNHDPLLRETLGGRYVIERLIGRGGIGLVYLATDKHENRRVVVKVLAPHWTDDEDAVARFDREALRMARLDHPNVVKMYDHGHHHDQAYIVMEFLDGEPLRQYLNRKKYLGFEEFIPIASQILAGVGYVHARNIMLRDIKPPNIMLCEREGKANHVKLLDFGLAKLMGEDDELTKAHVIGTAGYLSPEQIRGDKIDVRVDVYALGILFFIMLTGHSPIDGDNDAAVLFNHVHGTPRSLHDALPAGHRVSEEVVDLVHQCLAKLPADRPTDANEMAEVLFESVHPSMFLLPPASEESRATAREFWAKRLKKGGGSLEDLEPHSGEFTRPVVKRSLQEAREAARVTASRRSPTAQAPTPAQPVRAQAAPKAPPTPAHTPGRTALGMPLPRAERPPRVPPPPPKPSATALGLPIPKSMSPRDLSGPRPSVPARPASTETLPPFGGPAPTTGPTARATPERSYSAMPLPPGPTSPGPAARAPSPVVTPPPRMPMPGRTAPPTMPAAGASPSPLTMAFDAADARAAARKDHAPTGRVHAALASAAAVALGEGIPSAIPRTSDDDSLPISIEEDVGAPGPTPDVTAVGTGPITSIGTPVSAPPRRLGLVLGFSGLAALALGGGTAWMALTDDGDPPKTASSEAASGRDAADGDSESAADGEAPVADPAGEPDEDAAAPADADDGAADARVEEVGDPGAGAAPLGELPISGPKGARVIVDGVEVGTLPHTAKLAPGEHLVRVEAAGQEPWESVVEVGSGKNPTLVAPRVKRGRGSARPSKPSTAKPASEPKPAAAAAEPPKPKPKPKDDDVFINPSKGNDDGGIFLPVGK